MGSLRNGLLKAYRIADSRYPIFSGDGAQKVGGRWNSVGNPVIYASQNLSCAMLELMVHLNDIPIPECHKYIEISSKEEILIEDFKGININDSKGYGDEWLEEQRSLILIVPSVIVPNEKNILINPNHIDFNKLRVTKPEVMHWDMRLFN